MEKIKETGLYKTRDGRKALISHIVDEENKTFPFFGTIEGYDKVCNWTHQGHFTENGITGLDIVSKWES